jgi:hypothetical protein
MPPRGPAESAIHTIGDTGSKLPTNAQPLPDDAFCIVVTPR